MMILMLSVKACQHKYGIRVLPVKSPGFSGNKSVGYKMACNAIMELLKPHQIQGEKIWSKYSG